MKFKKRTGSGEKTQKGQRIELRYPASDTEFKEWINQYPY